MLWKVLLPAAVLAMFALWVVVDRDLRAFQVVASIPFLYMFVYFTVGAFAYRPRATVATSEIPDAALPFVSVLIPAHNEENVIANTLGHVLRMQYPRFEVIVVDDASTDRTGEIASGFPVRLLTRDDPSRRGKSEALNAALKVARGDVICVFDADSEMAPRFLRLAVAPLVARPEICGVQAQVRMYNRGHNVLTRAQDDEFAIHGEVLQLGRECLGGASALGGNGQLTRRSALDAVGGWNPSSLTEDLDLTVRLFLAGCGRIAHCTRAIVWQEGVPSLKALLRQRTRWAEGILRCYADHAWSVLTCPRMPITLRIDTFWALFSVFLPILSAASLVLSALNAVPEFFAHRLPGATGLWLLLVTLAASCVGTVTVSIKRDRRFTLIPALRSVVHSLHWIPAFACAFGRVVRNHQVIWEKTHHARPQAAGRRLALPAMDAREPDAVGAPVSASAVSMPM